MVDWIKEHKQYLIIGVIVLVVSIFYYLSSSEAKQLKALEEQWEPSDEQLLEEGKRENSEVEQESILVDIKGAVKSPGVYRGEEGDRVIDMIEKAGGLTKEANETAINFAMRISDEMVIYVPTKGEEREEEFPLPSTGQGEKEGKININKATAEELKTLPGIGDKKAEAIIEYRETNGPFKEIEDLIEVSGIGEKTFEKLKESLTVQ